MAYDRLQVTRDTVRVYHKEAFVCFLELFEAPRVGRRGTWRDGDRGRARGADNAPCEARKHICGTWIKFTQAKTTEMTTLVFSLVGVCAVFSLPAHRCHCHPHRLRHHSLDVPILIFALSRKPSLQRAIASGISMISDCSILVGRMPAICSIRKWFSLVVSLRRLARARVKPSENELGSESLRGS
jgi:hypothetical protein